MVIRFDAAASRAAKADGMKRAAAAANPAWTLQMLVHAVATAAEKQEFTSDDVFRRAMAAGMTEETHDRRAFGPVMLGLVKAHVCRKANRRAINSQRVSLHSSPRTVWLSLIFRERASYAA